MSRLTVDASQLTWTFDSEISQINGLRVYEYVAKLLSDSADIELYIGPKNKITCNHVNGELHILLQKSDAERCVVDGKLNAELLESKMWFAVQYMIFCFDPVITDRNGIKWTYLAHGSFNAIYETTLTSPLVCGDVTYPVGSRLVYRIPLPRCDRVDANSSERTSRLFNDRREKMGDEESYLPASVYESGLIAPFLDGKDIYDPAVLRKAILETYAKTGRVMYDGISFGNFKVLADGRIVSPDVSFSFSSESPVGDDYRKSHKFSYDRWFIKENKNNGVAIEMIKALAYLEFSFWPSLSFGEKVMRLENDPVAVSIFAMAYHGKVVLEVDNIQRYFETEEPLEWPAKSLLNPQDQYIAEFFSRYYKANDDVSALIQFSVALGIEELKDGVLNKDWIKALIRVLNCHNSLTTRTEEITMTFIVLYQIVQLKGLEMPDFFVNQVIQFIQKDTDASEIALNNQAVANLVAVMRKNKALLEKFNNTVIPVLEKFFPENTIFRQILLNIEKILTHIENPGHIKITLDAVLEIYKMRSLNSNEIADLMSFLLEQYDENIKKTIDIFNDCIEFQFPFFIVFETVKRAPANFTFTKQNVLEYLNTHSTCQKTLQFCKDNSDKSLRAFTSIFNTSIASIASIASVYSGPSSNATSRTDMSSPGF